VRNPHRALSPPPPVYATHLGSGAAPSAQLSRIQTKEEALRIPVADFAVGRTAAPASAYFRLPTPADSLALHNRFVGEYLVYGEGTGWNALEDAPAVSRIPVVRWSDMAVTELDVRHTVDRIEPMGTDVLVIGSGSGHMHFSTISLNTLPTVTQRFAQEGMILGEMRDDAIVYRSVGEGDGRIALPIRARGSSAQDHLADVAGAVWFVGRNATTFHDMGRLVPDTDISRDDGCVASCVDWYANSRPLFVRIACSHCSDTSSSRASPMVTRYGSDDDLSSHPRCRQRPAGDSGGNHQSLATQSWLRGTPIGGSRLHRLR
jgi:hypothetical protein